jgi:hypothetical protein
VGIARAAESMRADMQSENPDPEPIRRAMLAERVVVLRG